MLSVLKKAARAIIAKIIYYVLPSEIMKDQRFFCLWEKKGFHVIPVHFYSPIPEICSLSANLWKGESRLIGVELNESAQIELLSAFSSFKTEYDKFPNDKPSHRLTNSCLFTGRGVLFKIFMILIQSPFSARKDAR